jgi:endonuclease IV
MPLLGAHMSTSGGYYRAVDAAAEFKMDCVQIFTKYQPGWMPRTTIRCGRVSMCVPLTAGRVGLTRDFGVCWAELTIPE